MILPINELDQNFAFKKLCAMFCWDRSDHVCIFYFVFPLLQDTACLAFLGLFQKKKEGMEGLLSSHDVEKDCGNSIANSLLATLYLQTVL